MSNLLIESPKSYSPERKYVLSVLLSDRLGLEWDMVQTERENVRITCGESSSELLVSDKFFSTPPEYWCKKESLPTIPLQTFDTTSIFSEQHSFSKNLLVLFGSFGEVFVKQHNSISLPIDIFGSAFFLLTRYEEVVLLEESDLHGRFKASSTTLGKSNYLHRPLVDEYESLLWESIKLLWPSLQKRRSEYSLVMTHDVDIPFATKGCSMGKVVRRLGGDILVRKNLALASKRLASFVVPGKPGDALDPNNTFSWIMDQVENHGLRSEFYLMACPKTTHDTGYDIESKRINSLLKSIDQRGHTVGLHSSYDSVKGDDRVESELSRLNNALRKLGIQQEARGGRCHYLRWKAGFSWDQWEDAGLEYDSSVGHAEAVGFRAGTCKPYRAWSFSRKRDLNLVEKPLIIMDVSLLSRAYMNLKEESCKETIDSLISTVKEFRGELITLWHNDMFLDPVARRVFLYTLNQA